MTITIKLGSFVKLGAAGGIDTIGRVIDLAGTQAKVAWPDGRQGQFNVALLRVDNECMAALRDHLATVAARPKPAR